MDPNAKTGAARAKLLLLAALFALPIIAAMVLYFGGWRPARTGNYGELIQPPRPLAPVMFADLAGKPAMLPANDHKWVLVYFASAECGKACEDVLYKTRQVHIGIGEDSDRLRRVFVVTDPAAREWLHYVLKDHPGVQVLFGDPTTIANFAHAFLIAPEDRINQLHGVYLIDPNGNLMMHYAADADAKGMRKDLKHLLKLSRSG